MSIDIYIKGRLVYNIYSVYKCYIDLYKAIIELYRKVIFPDECDNWQMRFESKTCFG